MIPYDTKSLITSKSTSATLVTNVLYLTVHKRAESPTCCRTNNASYLDFFSASRFSAIPLFLLFSSHLSHPASAKSSSTTRSLIRNILDPFISSPHSTHPFLLSHIVTANHPTAENAPAALPTKTCLTVW